MKKSLFVAGSLIILAFFGMIGFGQYVGAQAEKVYLKETILLGDKSCAEGLFFQINSHWDEKLLWEVKTQIGEETSTNTEFSLYPDGFSYEIKADEKVQFEYPGGFGYGSSAPLLGEHGTNDIPYRKVFEAVAENTNAGEERTEVVNLSDYYEYFELNLHAESNAYLGYYASEGMTEIPYISDKVAMRIPKDLQFEATVKKENDGEVYDISGNFVEQDFGIMTGGVILQDGIYVYVYAKKEKDVLPGLSDTGYGIYRLPMVWGEDEIPMVMTEMFDIIYPTNEEILMLRADPLEKELFLLIRRGEELYLQRIDRESLTLLQEFELGITGALNECREMDVSDEGILLMMSDGQFYYAQKSGNDYEITVAHNMEEYPFFKENRGGEYAYTYQDGRLAFVWSGNADSGYWLLNCNSVYVFVLEGEEMKYLAYYENSLDQADTNYDYSNRLHPSKPYEVYFQ